MERHYYIYDTISQRESAETHNPASIIYTLESEIVEYTAPPPHDYSKDYLTFEALQDTTFTFTTNALQYSVDDGSTWTILAAGAASPTVAAGNKIMWKQTGLTPTSSAGIGTFSSTGQFNVQGNIMSLYYGDNFENQISLSGKNYAFYNLFNKCTNLISCEYLKLPATTLANYCYRNLLSRCTSLTIAPELSATKLLDYCYQGMFLGCTSLTTAPKLPATTLAISCYTSMFSGCTSLTTAPTTLPATTLMSDCYESMFYGCTSLTAAPELPATTLKGYCYNYMFQNCISLITAPELPATKAIFYCYNGMFSGCTSLITAPNLPATTVESRCYQGMFGGCTSLVNIPSILPATTLDTGCYSSMFGRCSKIKTAPILPAQKLVSDCYYSMFEGCTKLNYIKCLATDISADYSHTGWVSSVSSSGTFVKAASMTSWPTGTNGIPSGWTVQDA